MDKLDACQSLEDVDAASKYIQSQMANIDKASLDDLRKRRDEKKASIVPF